MYPSAGEGNMETFLPEGADGGGELSGEGGVLRHLHSKSRGCGQERELCLCPDEDRGQDGGKAAHVHQAPLGIAVGRCEVSMLYEPWRTVCQQQQRS